MKIKTYQPIMTDRKKITRTITRFWNKTSEAWKTIWGPHIHHGYYGEDDTLTPLAAQEKLIEKLANMLEISANCHILDVGCGMGGSSFYLAKNYHAHLTGITLSQKQIVIAKEMVEKNNIKNVVFKLDDALALNSVPNESIDIVWSLESCEQFYDKNLFLQQVYRVLKPGGQLLLATWCSDRDEYENVLAKKYRQLCLAFDLPYMPTIDYYRHRLNANGLQILNYFDWSPYVIKSWDIGLSLISAYTFLQILRMGGLRGLRFVKQIRLMRDAFHQQRVRYGVFYAKKPSYKK